jgi:hypothetical protein
LIDRNGWFARIERLIEEYRAAKQRRALAAGDRIVARGTDSGRQFVELAPLQ